MMLLNLHDVETAARARLPAMAYGYFAGGAHDGITLRENVAAFGRIALRYRVLAGVGERELKTTVLGAPVALPVLVAPMAFQRLAHPEGELATTRAVAAAGSIMILSTLATASLEDVRAAAPCPVWFQLYVYRDRELTRALVQRAEAAGYTALVVTVDTPVLGRREADVRNEFRLPDGLSLGNISAAGVDALPDAPSGSALAAYVADAMDPSLTWRDIEWLRSVTRLPIVLKGIVRGDDAARAVDAGAAAIIVSNHGGRQLDTAIPTIHALPDVVRGAGGRVEVLLDGGIRRGTDIAKALALGARAVLVGRPVLWGLAIDGEAGVARVLGMLREELDLAMALCGARTLADLTPDLIAPAFTS